MFKKECVTKGNQSFSKPFYLWFLIDRDPVSMEIQEEQV